MKKNLLMLMLIIILTGCGKMEAPINKKCIPFTGGSFSLKFETNDKNWSIEDTSVCIACSPNSYDKLPKPENNTEKKFEGWYYDSDFKNKVGGDSTLDITPKAKYDKNNCMIGYETVTLYAKYE